MIVDTHCHINFPQFDEDRDAVVARANEKEVQKMVTIGCDAESIPKTIEIAQAYDGVFAGIGIHPCDVAKNDADFSVVEKYISQEKVVAVGETGLDFFREENPTKAEQFDAFAKHIALAKTFHKPVIVHLRDAQKEAEEFLALHKDFSFVIHCFSGDWDFAKKILDAGGMISFTGIVTFKNASSELLEVAKKLPEDRILVETDAPFLAPVPVRGKRCEPAFVRYTAEFLATLRGETPEKFFAQTTKNAEEFFGI